MGITRYDPFRDLRTLQDEVNRLFTGNASRAFDDEGIARGSWSPHVDIYENKDQIVLEAELPGMKREDFDLSVENNVITLRGERHFEKKEETDNYHRVERAYGSFVRSFTLPNTVSAEGAVADYRNGVLRVTLPKRAASRLRAKALRPPLPLRRRQRVPKPQPNSSLLLSTRSGATGV
jgi:HSP20 family protein